MSNQQILEPVKKYSYFYRQAVLDFWKLWREGDEPILEEWIENQAIGDYISYLEELGLDWRLWFEGNRVTDNCAKEEQPNERL
mgnify:CR=1 FL=1